MTTFGPQVLGDLGTASNREWIVTDGLGGYAMGTIGGLRTRRYHGLLVVPVDGPARRCMGLVALDAVLVDGDVRTRLSTHEWSSGVIDPEGHVLLRTFDLDDGVPRWQWQVGDVVIERELAMVHGRTTVAVIHRLVSSPRPVRLECTALCTWRDAHGERLAGPDPEVAEDEDGFTFEGHYRVTGPGWSRTGEWYRGVHAREEAARGLTADEDVFAAGTFGGELAAPGDTLPVVATAVLEEAPDDAPDDAPVTGDDSAGSIVDGARTRTAFLMDAAGLPPSAGSTTVGRLVLAADRFVISTPDGPTVDAGYPWFGEWSRDAMTSYRGLFLATGRTEEGKALLRRAATSISEGMIANTTDGGAAMYNTIDASLWFVHAVGRHVEATADDGFGAEMLPAVAAVLDGYVAGTRFDIGVDDDGLVRGGADGVALTWMDARVDGRAVTPRSGKPVEIQALWIAALRIAAMLARRNELDAPAAVALLPTAFASFHSRFPRPDGLGLFDVVDGPDGDDESIRPNQILAVALRRGPFDDRRDLARLGVTMPESSAATAAGVVELCGRRLLTPLGLRTLDPTDPAYLGRHRGAPAERDAAYHQGTVWPWLLGAWVEASRRVGRDPGHDLAAMAAHLDEFGVGSVSETADGDAPHGCTGAPFQAWSVAEVLRVLRSRPPRRSDGASATEGGAGSEAATSRSGASRSSRRGRRRRG